MIYRVIHKSLRNFRTRLRNNQDRHSRKEHISVQRIGQKLGVPLLLLTCSSSAWLSRLLYRRGRKSRRDLRITLCLKTRHKLLFIEVECVKRTQLQDGNEVISDISALCTVGQVFVVRRLRRKAGGLKNPLKCVIRDGMKASWEVFLLELCIHYVVGWAFCVS
jgi:hypothetical protein